MDEFEKWLKENWDEAYHPLEEFVYYKLQEEIKRLKGSKQNPSSNE